MRASWVERPNFGARGRRFRREIKAKTLETLTKIILTGTETIIERTPVYTGKTLINFQWAVGSAPTDVLKPITTGGLPGKTSKMTLKDEPRRAANAAAVQQRAAEVIGELQINPFQEIFLVNNHDNYYAVEYGTYSENARTPPGGITRAAEAKIAAILEGQI